MGVSVRIKDGNRYVFIRHHGERAAQKCVDENHAKDTQKAVLTAIAAGQFDIAALQKKRDTAEEGNPAPTLDEYYKRFEKVYLNTSCREGTRDRYATSFK